MAAITAKPTPTRVRQKPKPSARLTKNDKGVMKRAQLLRGTVTKRKKEAEHESTDKPIKQ